jgi:hypothetical protein
MAAVVIIFDYVIVCRRDEPVRWPLTASSSRAAHLELGYGMSLENKAEVDLTFCCICRDNVCFIEDTVLRTRLCVQHVCLLCIYMYDLLTVYKSFVIHNPPRTR